jgi:hypothetical protein
MMAVDLVQSLPCAKFAMFMLLSYLMGVVMVLAVLQALLNWRAVPR